MKKKGKENMLLIENEQNSHEFTKELEDLIRLVCDKALSYEGFEEDAQISVTIVDNEQIQEINKEHRDIDAPTDVLSFPMLEFDEDGNACLEYDFDGEEVVLGDIVINMDRAIEQAEAYGHSLKREIAFLTAHSMLHLLGYDHMEPDEETEMFKKQEEILVSLGITREEK